MKYELNDCLTTLHQHILNEQLQIRTLINLISCQDGQELPCELPQELLTGKIIADNKIASDSNFVSNSMNPNKITIPDKTMNLSQVRANFENRQKRADSLPELPPQNWLVAGEKESRFNIFLKLNQQLQKWIDLEISLIKEIAKMQELSNKNSPDNINVDGELQSEDLIILRDYYNNIVSD